MTNKYHRGVISALTGIDIEAANPGKDIGMGSFDASKEASNRFKAGYSEKGLEKQIGDLKFLKNNVEIQLQSLIHTLKLTTRISDRKKMKKYIQIIKNQIKKINGSIKILQQEQKRMAGINKKVNLLKADILTSLQRIMLYTATLNSSPNMPKKQKAALLIKLRKAKSALNRANKKYIATDKDTLRQYGKSGFLNLTKDIVEAMKSAGFRWGGDWKTHKDFMHFEL